MKTEIAFILDRSSSMEAIGTAAIDGFNQYLRDQQAAPGQTNLSLVFFDTQTEHRYQSLPAAEILPLNEDTYVPNGCTALLDAVGETIDRLGKKLAALPAPDRPDHVSIAILTDGEENSSTRFTWKDIAARIKHQTEKYEWEFLFLGASADAIATAAKMNIHAHNSSAYMPDAAGSIAGMASFSRKSLATRAMKSGQATAQQIHDAVAPMSGIVREEDQKRRP